MGSNIGSNVNIAALSIIIAMLLIFTGPVVNKTLAFKLAASSYEDGTTRGMNDAMCDSNQCHGHGYDASCPSGHTNTFCRGYAKGYSEGWDQQSDGGSSGEQTDRGFNGGTEDRGFGGSNSNSDSSRNREMTGGTTSGPNWEQLCLNYGDTINIDPSDCSHYAHGHQLTSSGTTFLVKKLFDAAKTIGPLAQMLSLLG